MTHSIIIRIPVDAVVQWLQPITQTYLEYIVQIATLPPRFGLAHHEESYTDDEREQELADVCSSVTWKMAQSRKYVFSCIFFSGECGKDNHR